MFVRRLPRPLRHEKGHLLLKTIESPRTRPLYDWEIAEAQLVFGDRLKYKRIRVHELARWTDATDRLGRWLKRLPPPGPREHNAITLAYHCYFPVMLPETLVPPGDPLEYMMEWLMHELTHVWQYQRLGWRYLLLALRAQFRFGTAAYDFGGVENLISRRQLGWTLSQFNPEQEAEITRNYYHGLRRAEDVTAFLPYVEDIRGGEVGPFRV